MTTPTESSDPRPLSAGLSRYAERQAQLLGVIGATRTATGRRAQRAEARRASSIFDDLIDAVTSSSAEAAEPLILGPRSRYMVRVAKVGKPHRPTRRNYDYFEELNAMLAAQRAAGDELAPESD